MKFDIEVLDIIGTTKPLKKEQKKEDKKEPKKITIDPEKVQAAVDAHE